MKIRIACIGFHWKQHEAAFMEARKQAEELLGCKLLVEQHVNGRSYDMALVSAELPNVPCLSIFQIVDLRRLHYQEGVSAIRDTIHAMVSKHQIHQMQRLARVKLLVAH
jgi:hypothetical protein